MLAGQLESLLIYNAEKVRRDKVIADPVGSLRLRAVWTGARGAVAAGARKAASKNTNHGFAERRPE